MIVVAGVVITGGVWCCTYFSSGTRFSCGRLVLMAPIDVALALLFGVLLYASIASTTISRIPISILHVH
jgi:hypothetical protein